MALSNVNIKLENGALGRVAATSDGVAGMVLTGSAVAGKLELGKAYKLYSVRDLQKLGITEATNPLAFKDISAFYGEAGDGAELHVVIVADTTTISAMTTSGDGSTSALVNLLSAGGGRIRLVGLNKVATSAYQPTLTQGIDGDVITAAQAIQNLGDQYFDRMQPFRAMVPAYAWNGETTDLFKPSEGSYNRVGFVMAADKKIDTVYSNAIGQVLGRAASIEIHQSIGRVKSGAIAVSGWQADGSDPARAILGAGEELDDAGYIFYRTYPSKNGLYLNGDPMAASVSDDYSNLRYGRTIDKAALLAYSAYINEIQDNVEVDENGLIPVGACHYYESLLERAVLTHMAGQISSFDAFVSPEQAILTTETMEVVAKIVPQGITKIINVKLGFSNPALLNKEEETDETQD